MKVHIDVERDQEEKPRHIVIKRGRRTYKVDIAYTPQGKTSSFDIETSRRDMPSLTELFSIAHESVEVADQKGEAEIQEVGLLQAEDDTEVILTNTDWTKKKTIILHALDLKTIDQIHLEVKGVAGTYRGFKISKEIDDEADTDIVLAEGWSYAAYTWVYKLSPTDFAELEGNIIRVHLWLKCTGGAVYNRGFKVYGKRQLEEFVYV